MMHMRTARWLLLLPFLAACEPIFSDQPLGEVATLEPADWNGVWIGSSGEEGKSRVARFAVADAKAGVLDAPGLCEAAAEPCRLTIRRSGSWHFVVRDDPRDLRFGHCGDGSCRYSAVWLREGPALYWYAFDTAAVKNLIELGALPGRIGDEDKAILGPLTSQQMRVLLPERKNFGRRMPAVSMPAGETFVKLPDEVVPCEAARGDATRQPAGSRDVACAPGR